MPRVSVVVPCYNEAENLPELIRRLVPVLERHPDTRDFEILLIDDNSTDATGAVADRAAAADPRIRALHRTSSPGFGLAVREGLSAAAGDVVVPFMGDLSDEPEDVPRLVAAALQDRVQVAYGSRFVKGGSAEGYPPSKLLANRAFNTVVRLAFGVQHRDITNAFKAYRREVLDGVGLASLKSRSFDLTAELPIKAHILGYRAVEVPVAWHGRKAGVSKLKTARTGPLYARRFLSLFLLGNLLGLADLFREVLRRSLVALVAGIVLGLVLVWAAFQAFGTGDVVGALRGASPAWFAVAASLALLALALRVWRWSVLLRAAGSRVGRESAWRCILFSWFINYLLPFRAGDVARAVAIRLIEPVSVGSALGTVAVERAMDLMVLAAFLLVGASLLGGGASMGLLVTGGALLFLGVAAGLAGLHLGGERLAKSLERRTSRGAAAVRDARKVVQFVLANPPATFLALMLSVVVWLTEASTVFASCMALGIQVPFLGAASAGTAAFLAQAIPSGPGGFGLHEASITGVLTVLGVPGTAAAAASLLDHAARAVVVFVFGGIATIHLGFQSRAYFRERRASRRLAGDAAERQGEPAPRMGETVPPDALARD
jgi:hypothetical protein